MANIPPDLKCLNLKSKSQFKNLISDGDFKWFDFTLCPTLDASHDIRGAVGCARELSPPAVRGFEKLLTVALFVICFTFIEH